ncbi:hypothetical protein BX600DRAFT_482067 [Xylariales sp. PMI_506]|nr:hypothetical protein BX600DRAFT_482067 [Xylariales sp. PMI_506]
MTLKKPLHVIIVGGVERETEPRGRNWGVTLSWGHEQLRRLLPPELYANLRACQPDESLDVDTSTKQYVLIRDGLTGRNLAQAPHPGIRRLQIRKTKEQWKHGIDVQYGKKLVDINVLDDGVVAVFQDGSEQAGSVIVGADGGASNVRRWLLGEKLAAQEVLPLAFMNFPFTLPADKAVWLDHEMNPNVDVAPHPKGMYIGLFLLDKPDLDKPETWVFYLLTTWPIRSSEDEENAPNRLERLRAHMDGWADPYKSVVDWLSDDVAIGADQLRCWHPIEWDNQGGRATLAGDAAHSMTFHRGQGGNLAIRDADEFVNKMVLVRDGKQSLREAVGEYDEGVRERGQEVAISKASTMSFHDYDTFMNSPVIKMGIRPSTKG